MGLFRKKEAPVRVVLPAPDWGAIRYAWPQRPEIAGIRWRIDPKAKHEVVGESHYLHQLVALLGSYGDPGEQGYQEAQAPCILIREHDNPYDPAAVGVYVDGCLIGHVPADQSATVAWQLDLVGEHLAGVATLKGRMSGPIGVVHNIAL